MIKAYVAKEAKKQLEDFEYEERLKEHDVLISIQFCGICHSDVHLVDGDWGDIFPCVPGHEVIGKVEKVGDSVINIKKGDIVGVGWQCDSCGTCQYCEQEEETLCRKDQPTCMGHYGGFANQILANERFVIKIPQGMDLAKTAPLLCGGITVYTPLREYAKKGDSVAIIGIGGLGHLALQFAKAMGCHVTALSTSSDKEEEARKFGADEFLIKEPSENSFDLILNTAHFSPNMETYLGSLKPKGTFVQLGASPDTLNIAAISLIDGSKRVAGSTVGSPKLIKEMLELAKEKEIYPQIQTYSMKECNKALDITRKGEARYRIVLEN